MNVTYIAKTKMMFDIRKGDHIIHDTTLNTAILKRTGKKLPIDMNVEKKFFDTLIAPPIPSKFNIKDVVHLKLATMLPILREKGVNVTKHKTFKVPAFTPLTVLDVQLSVPGQRRAKPMFHYVIQLGEYYYKLDSFQENLLDKSEFYYFISSKGVVSRETKNKDAAADAYRHHVKNYFATKVDAAEALKEIKANQPSKIVKRKK